MAVLVGREVPLTTPVVVLQLPRRARELLTSGGQRALLGVVTCVVVILLVMLVGGVMAAQIHSHVRTIVIH